MTDDNDDRHFAFADCTTVSELLGQLAGAASMCWDPRPTGVFDSVTASRYVDGALIRLARLKEGNPVTFLPAGSWVDWCGYTVIDVVAMRTAGGSSAAEFLGVRGNWFALNDISVLHLESR